MRRTHMSIINTLLICMFCSCEGAPTSTSEKTRTGAPVVLTKEFDHDQYVGRIIVLQGILNPTKILQLHGVMLGGYSDEYKSHIGGTVHAIGILKSFDVEDDISLPFPKSRNGKMYYLYSLDDASKPAKPKAGEYQIRKGDILAP